MINCRHNFIQVTSSNATLFTLLGPNVDGVVVFLENTDPLNYISYQFQGSPTNNDGDYTNLAEGSGNQGVAGVLAPGGRAMVNIRVTNPYIRVQASSSGGALLHYTIAQFFPTSANFFTNGV